jgi:hypothetical protein
MVLVSATPDDFEDYYQMGLIARANAGFDDPVDDEHALRMFVIACTFDNFYCKKVVKDGVTKGFLLGVVQKNLWGMLTATDMFNYSTAGSHIINRDFIKWAKDMGASAVDITDISGNERYRRLLTRLGLEELGRSYTRKF